MSDERPIRSSLVFAGSFEDQLIAGIEQPTAHVATICDAIGEVAVATAGSPVQGVVINQAILSDEPELTIDAIRRVDPSTIVVIAGHDNQDTADAVVPTDTTAGRLVSAINASRLEAAPIPEEETINIDAVLGLDDVNLAGSADSSQLGDVDLVRSLMHDPSRFRDILMLLLKQQTDWQHCTVIDDETAHPPGSSVAPLRYGRNEHGFLAAIGTSPADLSRWARWAACWLELAKRQRDLKLLAYRDELSGAWNRRFLRTCLRRAIDEAKMERRPLTVMLFDIDDFKQYNDRWGHEAGDEIIREIVRMLRTIIRNGDHVCRIGGDEFAVLFCDPSPPREPGSNHPQSVEILAKRFREQVSRARFSKLGLDAQGSLSISGGLATFPWDAADADDLIRKADERLLKSKRQGKNCISIEGI
jgi:diguanylate cyclase (GGDEF)-like protein